MRTSLTVLALALATVASHATAASATGSSAPASADRAEESAMRPAADSLLIDGTIDAIDREQRILTLRNAGGERVRVHVASEVRAFEQLEKGERVRARFGDALSRRLAEDGAPSAEIERIDADTGIVTLRGPHGDTARVKLEAHTAELRAGTAVVVGLGDDAPRAGASRSGAPSDLSGTVIPRAPTVSGAQPRHGSTVAVGNDAGAATDPGMQRLLQASRELNDAVQAMARTSAGASREQARDRAREALFDTQRAMMDLPRTGGAPSGARTGASSPRPGSDADSGAGASTPTAGGLSLRLDSSTRSDAPSIRSGAIGGAER